MIKSEFLGTIVVFNEESWINEIINANYPYTVSGIKAIRFTVEKTPYSIVKIDVLQELNSVKKVKCLTMFEDLTKEKSIDLNKPYSLKSLFKDQSIGIIEINKIL